MFRLAPAAGFDGRLRRRLVVTGILVSALPLLSMTLWVERQFAMSARAQQQAAEVAKQRTRSEEATLAVQFSNAAQERTKKDLRLAQGVLEGLGGVQVRGRRVTWQATKEGTNEKISCRLPLLVLGRRPIRPPRTREDAGDAAGVSFTLFERMNERGDMLRVLTNEAGADGKRALGTFVPAESDAALDSILKKKDYVAGKMACAPVLSAKGDVIGMVSVTVPVAAGLRTGAALTATLRAQNSGMAVWPAAVAAGAMVLLSGLVWLWWSGRLSQHWERTAAEARSMGGNFQRFVAGIERASARQRDTALEGVAALARMAVAGRRLRQLGEQHKQQFGMTLEQSAATEKRTTEALRELDKLEQSMAETGQSHRQIRSILQSVDEIAFQSKILALNANIEAARAGAHGASFAVVAGEFGKLAARCAEAAETTTTLLGESVKRNLSDAARVTELAQQVRGIEQGRAALTTTVGQLALGARDHLELLVGEIVPALESASRSVEQQQLMAERVLSAAGRAQAQAAANVTTTLTAVAVRTKGKAARRRQAQQHRAFAATAQGGSQPAHREC